MAKKPKGFAEFDELARALVSVPKAAVDKKMARDKARRIAKRAKKK